MSQPRIQQQLLTATKSKRICQSEVESKQLAQHTKKIKVLNFGMGIDIESQQMHSHQVIKQMTKKFSQKLSQYLNIVPIDESQLSHLQKQLTLIQCQSISLLKGKAKIKPRIKTKPKSRIKNQPQPQAQSQPQPQTETMSGISEHIRIYKQKQYEKFKEYNESKIREKCERYLEELLGKIWVNGSTMQIQAGQFQHIRRNYLVRFGKFYKGPVELQYSRFIQKSLIQVIKKWQEHSNQNQKTHQQIKTSLQQQVHILAQSQQDLLMQIQKLSQKHSQSVNQSANYIEIIDRMQKLNENLRKEFQLVQQSENQLKSLMKSQAVQFGEREDRMGKQIKEFQADLKQSIQQIQNKQKQIERLNNEITNQHINHQLQLKQMLQIVTNQQYSKQPQLDQCLHLQQILCQKSKKIQQQYIQSTHTLHSQFQQTIQQLRKDHQCAINQKISRIQELQDLVNQQNIIIREKDLKIDYIGQQVGKDKDRDRIEAVRATEMQFRHLLKEAESRIQVQAGVIDKLQIEHAQVVKSMQNKIKELEETVKVMKQKSGKQIKRLAQKVKQNMNNAQAASQKKQLCLKKQQQVQTQQMTEKLAELCKKQQAQSQQIVQLHNKMHQLQTQLSQSQQKQASAYKKHAQLQMQLNVLKGEYQFAMESNGQLKHIIEGNQRELEAMGRIIGGVDGRLGEGVADDRFVSQLRQQISRIKQQKQKQQEQFNKKQLSYIQTIQSLKHKIQKYSKNPQIPTFQNAQKHASKSSNDEKIKILCEQNRILRQQLQLCKLNNDKLKNQTIKSINFHALMKKNGQVPQTIKQSPAQSHKTANTSQSQPHTLITQLYQQTLLLQHKNTEIQQLKQTLQKQQQLKIQLLNQKQAIQIQLEEGRAQWKIKEGNLMAQIGDIAKKLAMETREKLFWKGRIGQYQEQQRDRANGGFAYQGNYKQKIDSLFNKF